jgi:hypothetical protein
MLAVVLTLALPASATDSTKLVDAIDLPARADGLRKAGVPPDQVREALQAARDRGVPADEAEMVFEEAEKEARDKGPVDNFGAFVQARLDEGLRGRELAQAIKEEHARQGKGKGADKGKGPPDDKGSKGKAPDGGDKGGKGKAPDKGKGPPDGKGPDDDKGGKGGKGKGKAK